MAEPFNRKTTLTDGTTISTRRWLPEFSMLAGTSLVMVPPVFETMVSKQGVLLETRTFNSQAEAEAGHEQAIRAWQLITEGAPW